MRNVLVVSPYFPPVNTPDMQRVRMSLPYFAEFGWSPVVLAVEPEDAGRGEDPLLMETIPAGIPIRRVRAVPAKWTRKVGIGDVGFRAFPFLYSAGSRIIEEYDIGLIYFSTTVFWTMPLARLWKDRFGIPVVIDMQDPWVSDYYESKPKSKRPPKYWLARRLHKLLEPWTMRRVDGIIAVSEPYHEVLRSRYPWISRELCQTIPFGATGLDYQVAGRSRTENAYFRKGDGWIHGVYAGALGNATKQPTCIAICLAFKKGLAQCPELFSKVRLHFIGTDYAMGARARPTILPVAREMGLEDYIQEDPHWVPYFAVLNILRDADFLLIPGSDNPQYTASKVYPYILAQRPLLAVFHEASSVVDVVRSTQAGEVVTFSSTSETDEVASSLASTWLRICRRLPYQPNTDWEAFERYSAREMTRRQCELFDRVFQLKDRHGKPFEHRPVEARLPG